MGNVVSLVQIQHSSSTPAPEDPSHHPSLPRSAAAPSHINLLPPKALCAFTPTPLPSPSLCDNPFDSPPSSPPLPFYTAPSTPVASPQQEDPPPEAPSASIEQIAAFSAPPSPPPANPRLPPPPSQSSPCGIETIPPVDAFAASDLALDFTLDDEGLSTLEKIYLFSRSRSAHHRVFISHALPSFLANVTPLEAAEYVLPLLPSLAMDEDETVKEALASGLVEIVWWFLTHCLLVHESSDPGPIPVLRQRDGNDVTLISVQAFTPILGTLLLSPNGMVSGPARCTVVDLLCRIRKANDAEDSADTRPDDSHVLLLDQAQMHMFEEELIHQLVIGIGRLDAPAEEDDVAEVWYDAAARTPAGELPDGRHCTANLLADDPSVNPYFPHPASHESSTSSPTVTTCGGFLSPPPNAPSFQLTPEHLLGASPVMAGMTLRSEPACATVMLPPAELHADFEAHLNGMTHPDHRATLQEDGQGDEDLDPGEQAAVGRLSSMSLIAAVAAGGSLRPDAQRAFVREVERACKDTVHWVRREASFALGALAKVISEELAVSSLLPLFETLRKDTIWHVRHSSLFALPAVLSRLTPPLRRAVALSTVVSLSRDESSTVRSGVLESLGEVLYSFHADESGPPDELVSLFLGCQEDQSIPRAAALGLSVSLPVAPSKLDLFYDDPVRPLACAFNYPAVALTLGQARWGELRSLYLTLSRNRSMKVRKTLAASLGELAKVIGPENARRDLLDVWWDAMRCAEDGEIRLKAIEALPLFVSALGEGEARGSVFSGLVKIWEEGSFRNWRAREGIIKIIPELAGAPVYPERVHRLLKWGLEDDFGAVREASISAITYMRREDKPWRTVLELLRHDILQLAYAASFRKRMTFVACQQALVSSCQVDGYLADQSSWRALERLANDGIVGVRIGVARLAGCLVDKFSQCSAHVPQPVAALADRLRKDCSAEVRSYVPSAVDQATHSYHSGPFETFSRPPPMTRRAFAGPTSADPILG